jgi:hypothetical protein
MMFNVSALVFFELKRPYARRSHVREGSEEATPGLELEI